ncbi:N utilization substance protein B [Halobacillus andaensis]|uniref:Transcription antitermination protein NusB n=1 Tax=Halobacillus andaensis TaxID=1176239 RepID=A0A917AZA8_HALAA|nr:transcription antitermination factor NusB [Halobacillus andaensis]MBP2003138.1 N utilization substance protein B [Halobacillus andaensis]GGF08330.1 N utilization substance protein B [Halobacillus andaensis]
MKRRLAREKAFQALFQMNSSEIGADEAIAHVLNDEGKDAFLTELVEGVLEHRNEIDDWIETHLENWTFTRLARVEKTLLRMAAYEIKFNEDVPSQVAINEAVELAKIFGEDQSGKFVNGVLSKMVK